ncbi:MAG: glycosyltransferase family 4 protein [Fischerella sp.]|nr:glycosyltransferase family 4 protein [Fischerella sp.]
MNILHINQSDIIGGAAIAAYRLHQGLLAAGMNSRLLVGVAKTISDRVAEISRKYRSENQLFRITRRLGLNYINLISSFDIPKHSFYKEADVINLHNIHNNYFNYLAIPTLTESKPTVFTLHDMWSFTGHCAYSYDCERWKIGCGKCPYPDIYPPVSRDSTSLEWKLKNWIYRKSNLTIVTDSSWLAKQAKQSMLNCFPIHHIPYGIDTEAYQPLDIEKCRSLLGIPPRKKVLMFAAEHLNDIRKGGDLLLKSLQNLPESLKAETVLLTIGNGGETISKNVEMPTLNLGYVGGDRLKAIAYSAADLFLFPTRADAFGLVAQEAAACGTPTVSFNVGGVSDIVRPGVTGYLAQASDSQDFCNGIVQLLEDNNQRERMGKICREIVLREYPLQLQAQRYVEIYRQLLQ